MNKKLLFFVTLSFGFLLTLLSGCDWCSCCKKDSCSQKNTTVEPKTPQAVPVTHPEEPKKMSTPATEPQIIHPLIANEENSYSRPNEPKKIMQHPLEVQFPTPKMEPAMIEHPTMPAPTPKEPKIMLPHPIEPKMPLEPKVMQPKIEPAMIEHPTMPAPMPVAPKTV